MVDVFISYKREQRMHAEAIAKHLVEHGFPAIEIHPE